MGQGATNSSEPQGPNPKPWEPEKPDLRGGGGGGILTGSVALMSAPKVRFSSRLILKHHPAAPKPHLSTCARGWAGRAREALSAWGAGAGAGASDRPSQPQLCTGALASKRQRGARCVVGWAQARGCPPSPPVHSPARPAPLTEPAASATSPGQAGPDRQHGASQHPTQRQVHEANAAPTPPHPREQERKQAPSPHPAPPPPPPRPRLPPQALPHAPGPASIRLTHMMSPMVKQEIVVPKKAKVQMEPTLRMNLARR